MLNKCKIRTNLDKKGTIGVGKQSVVRGGKISFSEMGEVNIVFGSECRPLGKSDMIVILYSTSPLSTKLRLLQQSL
jgi:hypothetical protein